MAEKMTPKEFLDDFRRTNADMKAAYSINEVVALLKLYSAHSLSADNKTIDDFKIQLVKGLIRDIWLLQDGAECDAELNDATNSLNKYISKIELKKI